MNGWQPTKPTPADLAEARILLTRLAGGSRRDRSAFTYGYVLAFDLIAADLTDGALRRHLTRALALHKVCLQEYP